MRAAVTRGSALSRNTRTEVVHGRGRWSSINDSCLTSLIAKREDNASYPMQTTKERRVLFILRLKIPSDSRPCPSPCPENYAVGMSGDETLRDINDTEIASMIKEPESRANWFSLLLLFLFGCPGLTREFSTLTFPLL